MRSLSCSGSYCGLVLGCGHLLVLGNLQGLEAPVGQAGLEDLSLLAVLLDHGGLGVGMTEKSPW